MWPLALIPIEESIPAERQSFYVWIGAARSSYFQRSTDQRIMFVESLIAGNLYDKSDKLHFKASNATAAIGALTVRALRSMVSSRQDALPVLVVAFWNTRPQNIHREMPAARELCLASTLRSVVGNAVLLWYRPRRSPFSSRVDANLHA